MDKNILKKFAMESRTDLMDKVRSKIDRFYITEDFQVNKQGDIVNLVNEKHSISLDEKEYNHRNKLISRIKNYSNNDEIDEQGINGVVEEVAYTWFNRIIAIRYMEVNDITPISKDNQSLGFRILSSKDNQVDPEILKYTNLANPNLDINYDKDKYLNQDDDNKKFNILLITVCEKLGRVIPDVFDGQTDYIDILIPDNMLNETGFVTKVIRKIPEEYWKEQVEIIGWLYQYYNQSEKDRVISAKKQYQKNEIAYATQLFTPDWIVKYMVENSLGKYWIEHGGDKKLIDNWKYYIKGNEDNNQLKVKDINNMTVKEVNETLVSKISKISPTSIKCIDPCSGSGHILVYMFDVLYQIYESEGYSSSDIPELILKNNLYGLDIDDRAGQLSILAVLLKARSYDKDIFNKEVVKNLNIMAIQDSKVLSRIVKGRKNLEEQEDIKYSIDVFKDAKEIGSLLIVEQKDYNLILNKIEENYNTILDKDLLQEAKLLTKEAKILSDKYDIVVTNPPFMNKSYMTLKLKQYIDKNYKDVKYDCFSAFIKRNLIICNENGYCAYMSPYVWMFILSYIELRKYILKNTRISSLIQLEYNAFPEACVPVCTFALKKNAKKEIKSTFIKLSDFKGIENQEPKAIYAIQNSNCNYKYNINQNNFLKMANYILAYWLPEQVIKMFSNDENVEKYYNCKVGLGTGDNDRFLRFWYEININNKNWKHYNKAGTYRRWYGNRDYLINWNDDGNEIKNLRTNEGKLKSRPQNLNFMFKKSISWGDITISYLNARYYDESFLFDSCAPSLFLKESSKASLKYGLGFLNSKVVQMFMSVLSPTIHYNSGSMSKVPVIIKNNEQVEKIVTENIQLSKQDWDSFETSWDFVMHPLIELKNGAGYGKDVSKWNYRISDSFEAWQDECEERFNTLKKNEEELNKIFIDIYGLQDELTPEEEDKDVTVRKADRVRDIKSFISYAVGCMFGRYSLDKKGLVYAGGNFEATYEKYQGQRLIDEKGEPLPGNDGGWAGVSLTEYKYIYDGENEIELSYSPDLDNIIPITDTPYLGDDIVKRFKNFVEVVYGKETLSENLNYIAETLGKKEMESDEDTIRRYFLNDFYKDHVKTYQKRPIYWLFNSGKKNGFKALIYMHRYNEDTIAKLRIDYLHKIQEAYRHELNDIEQKLNTDVSVEEKRRLTKEQADLTAKLDELKPYEEKIAHLANQRIKIDLDDGVKVNYTKFQDVLAKIK